MTSLKVVVILAIMLTRRRQGDTSATGLWIKHDPVREADVVVYYVHGM